MAGLLSVDISQVTALVGRIAHAEPVVRRNMNKAGRQAGFIVEGRAKVEAPVDTGALRASIGPAVVKQAGITTTVEVTSHAEYSRAVHDGRREVVPVTAKVLHWDGPGGSVFSMRSRAVKANPYMDRGLQKSEPQVVGVFDRAMADTMRELGL